MLVRTLRVVTAHRLWIQKASSKRMITTMMRVGATRDRGQSEMVDEAIRVESGTAGTRRVGRTVGTNARSSTSIPSVVTMRVKSNLSFVMPEIKAAMGSNRTIVSGTSSRRCNVRVYMCLF